MKRNYELDGREREIAVFADGTLRCDYEDSGLAEDCDADELAEWAWSELGRDADELDVAALAMAAAAGWGVRLTPVQIAEAVHVCAMAWAMARVMEG